jgi:hypothetical protein
MNNLIISSLLIFFLTLYIILLFKNENFVNTYSFSKNDTNLMFTIQNKTYTIYTKKMVNQNQINCSSTSKLFFYFDLEFQFNNLPSDLITLTSNVDANCNRIFKAQYKNTNSMSNIGALTKSKNKFYVNDGNNSTEFNIFYSSNKDGVYVLLTFNININKNNEGNYNNLINASNNTLILYKIDSDYKLKLVDIYPNINGQTFVINSNILIKLPSIGSLLYTNITITNT